MICVIACMNASGSCTNAWASAERLIKYDGNEHLSSIFFNESRFAFLHSIQDCHSFVFTDVSFPLLDGSLVGPSVAPGCLMP